MKRLLLLGLALGVVGIGCGKDLPVSGSSDGESERVVLTELFTSLNCANCPEAEEALDHLYDEEGPADLAVIHWHPTRTLPDALGIPESDDRYEAYAQKNSEIIGMPAAMFNGIAPIMGGTTETYDHYRNRFNSESVLAAQAEITLSPVLVGSQVQVGVEVETAEALLEGTFDLSIVLVEHKVPKPAGEPGPDTLSFVARVVSPHQITITMPSGQNHDTMLSIDPSFNQDRLYVVAILQEPDFGEVLQAAMAKVEEEGPGTFGFSITAADTSHVVEVSEEPYFAHIRFENTGTLSDTLRIDLPEDYRSLPEGWSAFLCTEEGLCFPTPYDHYLTAGEVEEHLVIDLYALQPGEGWVGITVQSLGDPTLTDTLRIHFSTESPGGYSFTATAPETEFQDVPLDLAVAADLVFENTGEMDDLLSVDIDTDQSTVPGDWALSICDKRGYCIGYHLDLPLSAGETNEDWIIDCIPSSAGSAHIVVTVKSTGDPTQTATLTFDIATAGASAGFDRTVLGEMFTTWWCANCPEAEVALDQLHEEETGEALAVIHWHPGNGDIGGLGILETDTRLSAYTTRFGGSTAYPTVVFSGNERIVGVSDLDTDPDTTYAEYTTSYQAQASMKVPVDVVAQAGATAEQINVTVDLEAITGMDARDLDLHVVVVEHEAPLPMIPTSIFSYVARRANVHAVTMTGGDSSQVTSQFTIEESWNLEHIHIVAFLQEQDYGEVLQSAMIPLPQGAFLAAGASQEGERTK